MSRAETLRAPSPIPYAGAQVVRSEEDADDELLSVAVLKGGSKVVVGTGNGTLAIFSWGHWEDCSDRFPGALVVPHPSITCYDAR